MAERDANGTRIHEPSLRDLSFDVDGCTKAITALRELLLAKIEAQSDALAAADKRYEQRFIAQEGAVSSALMSQEKAVGAALVAADRAVSKVETANEKRFEAVNEFRAQLADQAAGFIPRNEATIRFDSVIDRISGMQRQFDDKHEQARSEIQVIRTDQTLALGKGAGMNQIWSYIIAAAGSGGVLAWLMSHYAKP